MAKPEASPDKSPRLASRDHQPRPPARPHGRTRVLLAPPLLAPRSPLSASSLASAIATGSPDHNAHEAARRPLVSKAHHMSRALALAVLLLAAAAVAAPLASAEGVESIPGAKELAGGAEKLAVGADPEPSPVSGLPADPAPDARP
ncbi:hypothetical protein HU200_001038 [Digitaria exilis]|uniref:Uncharacterized protein n=1 Tax=Digitaria exilis TaxID=1010633 RepID=A0A835G0V7_9POAL|nr:hypothetical protein HU200_001038 [Digitaria exilis]